MKQSLKQLLKHNMELVTEPDVYSPSINDMGNYVDKIPAFTPLKISIRTADETSTKLPVTL